MLKFATCNCVYLACISLEELYRSACFAACARYADARPRAAWGNVDRVSLAWDSGGISHASTQLPVPCIQLFLSCEDGTLCTLAVGANGRVVLTAHSEGSETASYWNTGSSALYDALLSMVN